MWGRAINDITEEDLRALVADHVEESKTIDFKSALPESSYAGVKEFLADVSSFANAIGGYIVIGVKERGGVAVGLPGVELPDPEAGILRLEAMIRDGIDPRIPGINIRCLPLKNRRKIVLIHIPRSWTPPHVVAYKKHFRFYSRNSKGKYPLDVGETRQLFALGESATEWIRSFRIARIASLVAGEGPLPLEDGPKTIVHLVPLSASIAGSQLYDVVELEQDRVFVQPLHARGWDNRLNLDGLVTFRENDGAKTAHTYVQVFRHGAIEAVETRLLGCGEDRNLIASEAFEEELIQGLPRFTSVQRRLGVEPPIVVMISLIGVSGLRMAAPRGWGRQEHNFIDRDQVILPELMLDSFDYRAHEILRPVFDAIWNAAGWPRSIYYKEDGSWARRSR